MADPIDWSTFSDEQLAGLADAGGQFAAGAAAALAVRTGTPVSAAVAAANVQAVTDAHRQVTDAHAAAVAALAMAQSQLLTLSEATEALKAAADALVVG